jgi:hypothetical protein
MSGPATGITSLKGARSLTGADEASLVRLLNADTGASSVRRTTLGR